MHKQILIVLVLFVGSVWVLAADTPLDLLSSAKQLYYAGVAGNATDLSRSAELFEQLKESAKQPEIDAYRGSLLLIEAGQTLAIWKKSDLSKRGLELLDRSVAAHPTNLEIRFVRAATTLHLPGFFRRRGQSCEDLRYIAPLAADAAAKQELDRRIAAGALFMYAKNCASDTVLPADDAMRQAMTVAPDSPAGLAAAQELTGRR